MPALRRLTAHKLSVRGSRMPGAAVGLTVGPDNIDFRKRLRRAHPETEKAMQKQRRACVQVRTTHATRAIQGLPKPTSVISARYRRSMSKLIARFHRPRCAQSTETQHSLISCLNLERQNNAVNGIWIVFRETFAPDAIQAAQAAFAVKDFNAALYWFRAIRTWAPSSWDAEVNQCKAAGAFSAAASIAL